MEKPTNSRASRTMKFLRGVFRFRSPGRKELTRDLSDDEKLKLLEEKLSLPQLTFAEKVSNFGLLPVLRSYILRTRYICALWLTREIAILLYLRQNYEKVPRWTLSKLFAKPRLSRLVVRIFKGLAEMLFPLGAISTNSVRVLTGNNN